MSEEQKKVHISTDKEVPSGVIDALPLEPFIAKTSTKVRLMIKNISDSPGIRIRFHAEDYINPTSIDLDIPPGSTKLIAINIVPLEKGERDCLVEFAPLYDEQGRLIPGNAADPIVVNRFSYKVRDELVGGLTKSQRSILSNIIKIASMSLVIAGVVIAAVPDFRSIFSEEFLTLFLSIVLALQLPILGVYFFFANRLPQA